MLIKTKQDNKFIRTISIIFLLLLAIFFILFLNGPNLANFIAKKIYPDLRIPYDNEIPPTPTSYPPSSSITAVIGGKGEGISCSIPSWLQGLIFYRNDGDDEIALQLRQACAYHDYCYRHGWATYGYSQVDCDFKLQEYAYRLCRQISKQSKSHEQCLSNARTVLLGVRLGGGGPFQNGSKSSFFEFDPIPIRADDYVVSRWINSHQVKKDNFVGQFYSYRFKRGNVGIRSIVWNIIDKGGNKKVNDLEPLKDNHFPSQVIPTPPKIFHDGSKDRAIAIARHNQNTTEISAIEYNSDLNNKFELKSLPLKEKDPNASIFWLFNIKEKIIISYWSNYRGLGILPIDLSTNIKLLPGSASEYSQWEPRKPVNKKIYQTLAHVPLTGYFLQPDCPQTIIFKRGDIDEGFNELPQSKDYQQKLHLIFSSIPNKNCTLPKELTIKATENNEPITTVRIDDNHDVLVNINNENNNSTLKIFDLSNCQNQPCEAQSLNITVNDKNLDGTWLRQPVQIVSSQIPNEPTLIFLSRIIPPPNQKADEPSSIIRYEFAYFRIKSLKNNIYSIETIGLSQCKIDLREQYMADINNPLISMILRIDADRINNLKKIESNPTEVSKINKPFEPYIYSDFYERWANSQVIPGWFVKHDINPNNSTPLDVAVIFRGHVDYSFLAEGVTTSKYHSLKTLAPINSYVKCEASTQFDNITDASD